MTGANIGTGEIVLLGPIGYRWRDRKMTTLVFIKNSDEDRWRVKVRNTIALDCPHESELEARAIVMIGVILT